MNAPSPSPELLRRQRVFIAGILVLAVCEAAGLVYYFADPARPWSAFAFFLAAGLAVLVWSMAGARWIRAAQPSSSTRTRRRPGTASGMGSSAAAAPSASDWHGEFSWRCGTAGAH